MDVRATPHLDTLVRRARILTLESLFIFCFFFGGRSDEDLTKISQNKSDPHAKILPNSLMETNLVEY